MPASISETWWTQGLPNLWCSFKKKKNLSAFKIQILLCSRFCCFSAWSTKLTLNLTQPAWLSLSNWSCTDFKLSREIQLLKDSGLFFFPPIQIIAKYYLAFSAVLQLLVLLSESNMGKVLTQMFCAAYGNKCTASPLLLWTNHFAVLTIRF